MYHSREGEIVDKWIKDAILKLGGIIIEHYVIMPDHLHLIIELREAPQFKMPEISLDTKSTDYEKWRIQRKNMLLPKVISYIKANSAREINRLNNVSEVSFWQANYFERIVRDANEYHNIVMYIRNNPANWKKGKNPCKDNPGIVPT